MQLFRYIFAFKKENVLERQAGSKMAIIFKANGHMRQDFIKCNRS